ncbi:MAG: flagellar filament capping protein FliD, partial [Lachnospiraceae bacterium]|nr:flagellar filament capping protein FliD [Lachnospiraceae bacterium]
GGTISDVLTQLKKAGLNASFDETNQRFFISAKQSGKDYDFSFSGDSAAIEKLGLRVAGENETVTDSMATKIKGDDAVIYLNGAKFTNSNNTFNINGLTITALGKTEANEEITLTTENDTSGIYDTIKSFLKTYNTIINKLDKAYNADAARGYSPLTDEEKEAMSEKEVEEYEKKIKDSLLRSDSTVSSIITALTSSSSAGYKVGDKTMFLSNFGIGTLGYFNSPENERNALHIDGDSDDDNTSGKSDKLLNMIKNDPESVVSFFTQMSNDLYTKMNKLSSSIDGQRSYGSFFEDKKMKADYTSYTTKIAEMEEKVNDYEDRLYKQYAAMEKAMAQLQSKTNSLSGLFGGGN